MTIRKRYAMCVLAVCLGNARALGDEVALRDRFGDPLPKGAVARLGFLRVGSSSPLNIADGPLAAFSPDGKHFVSVCHSRIYLWDLKTGRVKHRFESADLGIGRVFFVDDGKRLLAQERGGKLHAWDVASGKRVWKDIEGMLLWGDMPISPRGRWTIDSRGDVWDLAAGKKGGVFGQRASRVPAVFSHDERFLFVQTHERKDGQDEYALEQRDVVTGKLERRFPGFSAGFIACSPDGRTIAGVHVIRDPKIVNKHTYTIVFFDVIDGRELRRLPAGALHFHQPVFSHDGKQLAAVDSNSALNLWDVATGKTLHTWAYKPDYLTFLAFSPDGQWLGACGTGGTAVLLNTATGEPRFLSEEFMYRATDL